MPPTISTGGRESFFRTHTGSGIVFKKWTLRHVESGAIRHNRLVQIRHPQGGRESFLETIPDPLWKSRLNRSPIGGVLPGDCGNA